MPLYNNQQNYATLGMQAHQGAASTAANMRPGTTTKQNVSPLSSMAMGGLMGAQLAGTEVGAGALTSLGGALGMAPLSTAAGALTPAGLAAAGGGAGALATGATAGGAAASLAAAEALTATGASVGGGIATGATAGSMAGPIGIGVGALIGLASMFL